MSFDIQGMLEWAAYWCNRENVGYSQSWDYRNMGLKKGYITCFDCASFTFFAIWQGGGYDIGQLGYKTDFEKYKTMKGADGYNAWDVSGSRRALPYIGYVNMKPVPTIWQPGDILIKLHQHTEICYASPRRTMGAHSDSYALEYQVSINSGDTKMGYYDELWRYNGDDYTPIGPPCPPDPGAPGNTGYQRKMPLWMMTKPWWKV